MSRWDHSPGPWFYRGPTKAVPSAWIYSHDSRTVCELNDNRHEYEANARLIAAAPEMYEVLRNLVMDQGPCSLDHEGYCQPHGVSKPCGVATGLDVLYKVQGRKS